MLQEPNYIEEVSSELGFKSFQTKVVLDLIAEGATVPFIARYRKESTGNLDEDNIRDIIELRDKIEKLYKAKVTAINGIEELKLMTPELMDNILKAKTLKEVEEIYKPYKSKKKTKAMIAIEKGFQVIADMIKENKDIAYIVETHCNVSLLEKYSQNEIIQGSIHIISAEISANSDLRAELIELLKKKGNIISKKKTDKSLEKLNIKDKGQIPKFDLYSDFNHKITYLKPYQVLALNRGESIGILSVKIEKTDEIYNEIKRCYGGILNINSVFVENLEEAFKDGYSTLFKSVENELRAELSDFGEDDAIDTFRDNLGKLLMTKPEYGKKILAFDPGYKAGCKMVILDELGDPVLFDKIFLHKKEEAKSKIKLLIEKNNIDVIIVGNGTGVDETVELLQDITKLEVYIVNESGASVYSASKTAKEEFPDLDSLDRGTVSIGRRYIDPLSELVKIPVGSIGVGMYQHDMPEKKLEEKLGYVVEDTVNKVGINVNTASSFVLNHISGIDKRGAKKIFNNRPYKSRVALKKVLSDKIYEQAIGFLRVPESKQKFDNTDIHPEQYELAEFTIENINDNNSEQFFNNNKAQLIEYYPDVNVSTIYFIVESYNNIGDDPRVNSTHKKASKKVDISEIKVGDVLEGNVRNVVAFGAFVDIGTKNDGLVHVSQIANEYVSDPKEFVEVGQSVKVKIIKIDEGTGKMQLSMKDL